jgi:hypothetical protein
MRTKQKKSRRKTRKGGSKYFYPLNTKPMIFTNVSNQQGGDNRNTLMPSFLMNVARDTGHQVHKLFNAGMGKYEPTNPSTLVQNLIKR